MNLLECRSRLRERLNDPEGNLWADPVLDEQIRAALAELQQVCPLELALAGLDGAETNVLDGMETLLLRRAACLALRQRLLVRSEVYHPDPPEKGSWQDLLTQEEAAVHLLLEQRRRWYLQRSDQLPYALWPEV